MSEVVQNTVTVGGLTINAGTPILTLAERIRDLTAELADAKALADSEGSRAVEAVRLKRQWRAAIQRAYGYLWHVNNEPGTPHQYSPEKAAYEARKTLRDLLTHEQRGVGINMAHEAITAAAADKQSQWCSHCGCGNDTAGYAHAPLCPSALSKASPPSDRQEGGQA